MVSVKLTLVASIAPVLVMVTVYIMVSPGLTVAICARLSVLVAVSVVANGLAILAGSSLSFNGLLRALLLAPTVGFPLRAVWFPLGRAGSARALSFRFNGERSLD